MSLPELAGRLTEVRDRIALAVTKGGHRQSVQIVAVTKGHGPEAVGEAYAAGLKAVGENRVQEALAKMESVTAPVEWHLIGHLQRNKVKHLGRFHLFHALDSSRLADSVCEHGRSTSSPVAVLLQVNISSEASKGGFTPTELPAEAARLAARPELKIRGVMTMAPFGAPEAVLRETFGGARAALGVLREAGHEASELSMGMSDDFEIAVEEGATMVRLGTILFGARVT